MSLALTVIVLYPLGVLMGELPGRRKAYRHWLRVLRKMRPRKEKIVHSVGISYHDYAAALGGLVYDTDYQRRMNQAMLPMSGGMLGQMRNNYSAQLMPSYFAGSDDIGPQMDMQKFLPLSSGIPGQNLLCQPKP